MSRSLDMEVQVTELKLEQYLLGELDPNERSAIEADQFAMSRIQQMRQEDIRILRELPPDTQVPAILERAASSKPAAQTRELRFGKRRPSAARTLGLAAAAGIVLVAGLAIGGLPAGEGDETRVKGGSPELVLYTPDSDGSAREVQPNEAVPANTLLQVAYRAGSASYGAVFSIDGNGMVTRHFPDTEDGSTLLDPDGEARLPFAYRLDDAPGFEDFVFLTSNAPIALRPVEQSLRTAARNGRVRADSLTLPAGISVSVFRLSKDGQQ